MSVTAGLAGLSGCQTASDDGSEQTGPPQQSDTETSTTDGMSSERPDGPIPSVGIETATYWLHSDRRTADHRAIEPDDIVPAADLPGSLRSALEAARDGGYETETVSDDLLSAIDRFRFHGGGYRFEPYVSLDGEPFEFDPTVPVFLARLTEDGADSADPERTVEYDDIDGFEDPVREFVRTIGAFSAQVPRDEYRTSVVSDAVREFLDRYAYVEDPTGVGRIEIERLDPGPPYTIAVRELTTQDLWGSRVLDASSLPEDLRAFLRRVVESERRAPAHPPGRTEYRTDEVPDAYFDRFRSDEGSPIGPFAALDGHIYAFRLEESRRERLPVEVSVAVDRSRESPAFTLSVAPSETGAQPPTEAGVELEATGALPSILWVHADGERHLLPSDAYESVNWVATDGSSASVDRRARNVARERIGRDGTLSATYRVPEGVPAGTYRCWGRFGVSWTDAETGDQYPKFPYPFQVEVAVRDG